MSSEFGYIPESPEQSFGNNKGILTPNDIYDLTRADKFTNYGQLELIETQTPTGVDSVTFSTFEDYDIHLFTFNDFHFGADNADLFSRVLVGGSEQSGASDYGRAFQACAPSYFYEDADPDLHSLRHIPEIGSATNETLQGFIYMTNAIKPEKYTFFTQMFTGIKYDQKSLSNFGGGIYQISNTLSGIKFYTSGSGGIASATISIYGIKEYS